MALDAQEAGFHEKCGHDLHREDDAEDGPTSAA
jgi:hypothetical protein